MYYTKFNTRFCKVILAGDEKGLSHLHFNTGEGSREFEIQESWEFKLDFFEDIKLQVLEYLDGKRKTFNVALNATGTEFQEKVWAKLCDIPYGSLVSYKDIAKKMGNSKASRAVGAANGKNPIPLIIPCHRVVGSNGDLTGFAHGLNIKEKLIALEKRSAHK
ncbi:MAG: methylated-DNA--[protein]-cysteine S-methyltransferase [Desulfobacterium sp.]